MTSAKPVTICVLTFADYPALARRCLRSIQRLCDRSQYHLIVGANAVSRETLGYLEALHEARAIDQLIVSQHNLSKCPMMRRMFSQVRSEFVWWFDDDSYVTRRTALPARLRLARGAPPRTVIWGQLALCNHPRDFWNFQDPVVFVRSSSWYRGLTPPFWQPGGKGEFNFRNRGTGDGRWFFALGGCWFIRTRAIRKLDWPDRRLSRHGDDVFLGEAIRQHGWTLANIGPLGTRANAHTRRGEPPLADAIGTTNCCS